MFFSQQFAGVSDVQPFIIVAIAGGSTDVAQALGVPDVGGGFAAGHDEVVVGQEVTQSVREFDPDGLGAQKVDAGVFVFDAIQPM